MRVVAILAVLLGLLTPARGEVACQAHSAMGGARIERAALAADQVKITFVGHATFLIETPKGVRIATDYNDYVRPRAVPDIATMNRAHDTHFSRSPDPGIAHVLKGWSETSAMARHDLTFQDVRVRNVPTNIRTYEGTERYGNSIFVFEVAGLCIAHLGHLHHTLTPEHLRTIGQLDVVLVPVDGSFTMDQDGMVEVLDTLGARLVIPMHYFGQSTLQRFLDRLGQNYDIERSPVGEVTVSRTSLPAKPKVLVLPGRLF
ncbi:MAG TPA: MBL fold metallo-hydrolase [Beijerinckiaceae bacterium]|nr:MBL fold metallo-hydrolase [Beijerinckiaceae bacterium]